MRPLSQPSRAPSRVDRIDSSEEAKKLNVDKEDGYTENFEVLSSQSQKTEQHLALVQ